LALSVSEPLDHLKKTLSPESALLLSVTVVAFMSPLSLSILYSGETDWNPSNQDHEFCHSRISNPIFSFRRHPHKLSLHKRALESELTLGLQGLKYEERSAAPFLSHCIYLPFEKFSQAGDVQLFSFPESAGCFTTV
jgi:hypothetical protein